VALRLGIIMKKRSNLAILGKSLKEILKIKIKTTTNAVKFDNRCKALPLRKLL